jgi:hypothetical protein
MCATNERRGVDTLEVREVWCENHFCRKMCGGRGNKLGEVMAGQFVSTHRGRSTYGAAAVKCERCGHVNHLPAQWTERKTTTEGEK